MSRKPLKGKQQLFGEHKDTRQYRTKVARLLGMETVLFRQSHCAEERVHWTIHPLRQMTPSRDDGDVGRGRRASRRKRKSSARNGAARKEQHSRGVDRDRGACFWTFI